MAGFKSPAQEFSERWFGGPTRPAATVLALTAVAKQNAIPANPNRLELIIINNDATNTAFFLPSGFVGSITAANGIPVFANGGTRVFKADEDGELVTYGFDGIAGGNLNVTFIEVIRDTQ